MHALIIFNDEEGYSSYLYINDQGQVYECKEKPRLRNIQNEYRVWEGLCSVYKLGPAKWPPINRDGDEIEVTLVYDPPEAANV